MYVPTTVPVKLIASPIYGLPSLVVPVPAASGACNVLASVTTASNVPSYTLLTGTLNPDIVNDFWVIVAPLGNCVVNV